ncbi:MAG: HTH-type transcriptional regulator CysB, partial [Haliea sp.]
IKTYVRLGLGIGIVAAMAYDERADADLVPLDASKLFASSVTKIGCRRGTFLRGYMYDFIEDFAPHLTRDVVQEAFSHPNKSELDELFSHIELPVY